MRLIVDLEGEEIKMFIQTLTISDCHASDKIKKFNEKLRSRFRESVDYEELNNALK